MLTIDFHALEANFKETEELKALNMKDRAAVLLNCMMEIHEVYLDLLRKMQKSQQTSVMWPQIGNDQSAGLVGAVITGVEIDAEGDLKLSLADGRVHALHHVFGAASLPIMVSEDLNSEISAAPHPLGAQHSTGRPISLKG